MDYFEEDESHKDEHEKGYFPFYFTLFILLYFELFNLAGFYYMFGHGVCYWDDPEDDAGSEWTVYENMWNASGSDGFNEDGTRARLTYAEFIFRRHHRYHTHLKYIIYEDFEDMMDEAPNLDPYIDVNLDFVDNLLIFDDLYKVSNFTNYNNYGFFLRTDILWVEFYQMNYIFHNDFDSTASNSSFQKIKEKKEKIEIYFEEKTTRKEKALERDFLYTLTQDFISEGLYEYSWYDVDLIYYKTNAKMEFPEYKRLNFLKKYNPDNFVE